jgi:molybdopterin converting factor small subunit
MEVRLFASLREAHGEDTFQVEVPSFPISVPAFRLLAEAQFPVLEGKTFQVARNTRYVRGSDVLKATDAVAFLPPVSGG